MLPLGQINVPLASVAITSLSRLRDDFPRYRDYYLRVIFLITLVSTPLVCFFIVCSRDLILLVLGSQWTAASNIFLVLGFSALIQPVYFTQGWLHISAGRTDRYLRWGLVGSFIIVVGFILGLPYGPLGVAVSYTASTYAIIIPCMRYAGGSAGIAGKDIFWAVGKNIAAGFGTIAILFVLLAHFQSSETTWVNLLVGLCSVCLTYNGLLLVLYRDLSPWRQIGDLARTFVRSSARKTSAPVSDD